MKASAIVVTYRTGPVLFEALAALTASRQVERIEVVDNGNPPDIRQRLQALAAETPMLRYRPLTDNLGFAAACNMGAAAASSEALLFVNPDAVLRPGAVETLLSALATAPPLSVLGGDLRTPDGRPDRGSRRKRVTIASALATAIGFPRGADIHLHTEPTPNAPTRVGAISGALMAIRTADFKALGGFDEGYFLHMEDVDLCRRVEDAGGAVLFVPGPHGVHHRSSSEVAPGFVARAKARSFGRYFRKFSRSWPERLVAEFAALLLALALPLKARL
jgi:hypothetical protein